MAAGWANHVLVITAQAQAFKNIAADFAFEFSEPKIRDYRIFFM
jgi:hypothetical protein